MIREKIRQAVEAVRRHTSIAPTVAAVLGSGLGALVDVESDRAEIPYSEIPHWPPVGVEGHAGVLVVGRLGGSAVALLKGRAHYYEGGPTESVAFPVRVLAALGAKTLVVTCASGGVRASLRPGDIVAISDHINLMGANPLRGPHEEALGPRFVEMTEAYDRALRKRAAALARRAKIRLQEGVYVAAHGPSYETPAEIRMVARIGGDLIGMSTVPEVIVARQAGLRVLGLSLVTNRAAGLAKKPLAHAEVLETARRSQPRFGALLGSVLADLGSA